MRSATPTRVFGKMEPRILNRIFSPTNDTDLDPHARYIIQKIFLTNFSDIKGNNGYGNGRQRRYLLFTPNTQYGVFATISIPIETDSTVSVSWFFEANYYNVANASYLEPLLGDIIFDAKRGQRSAEERPDIITRKSIYIFIESMLKRHGYSGRACLLRAICEGTTSHFWHNGVLGDVLYLILTPSTSISEDDIEDCYYEAEYYGLEDNCNTYIADCPQSPLEFITMNLN